MIDHRESAILADAPHVIRKENQDDDRQEEHVQNVEPDQSVLIDGAAAEEEEADRFADKGGRAGDVGADRDSPVRKLIPRKEIAGKGKQQRYDQQNQSDDPV